MVARRIVPEKGRDRVLGAAGSFTGLWALTWLSATAAGAAPALQGGFAIGGVMAGSGLTALWWRVSALKELDSDKRKAEAEAEASA